MKKIPTLYTKNSKGRYQEYKIPENDISNTLGFTRENGVDYYSGVHLINPTTVCMFTGEKDMNWKEIYTGDIISNLETGSVFEVVWNDRLKRLDCKILNGVNGAGVPLGIFVSRYKRIVVLMSKFDKEK